MTENQKWLMIERINLLVTLTGTSQTTLAKIVGISKQSLSHYLKGRRVIDDIVMDGIAKHFNVPVKIFTQHEVYMVLKGNKLIIL